MNKLEEEFDAQFNLANKKIQEKLSEAEKLIIEAQKISDESGIPFNSSLAFTNNTYIPESMKEKFKDFDWEELKDLIQNYDCYFEYGEDFGWQTSYC